MTLDALVPATVGVLSCVVLFAPRRWALLAMAFGILYLTMGHAVEVMDLRLYPVRLLTLAAFVRVLARKEWSDNGLLAIDKLVIAVYAYQAVAFLLNGNGSATSGIAPTVDALLAYFACRGLVRHTEDLTRFLQDFTPLLVVYAALVYLEMSTRQNPFSIVGGIQQEVIRNGRPRCIGSFGHASLLGTFGASFIPLYIALWMSRTGRLLAVVGILACLGIVLLSNSGGPLSCAALGIVAWLLWPQRGRMHWLRRGMVGALLFLAVFMEAPLWYLPAKLSMFSGGDGWHRSYLMELAIRHFGEWWLAGMPVIRTRDWFPYVVVTGGADLINYYLVFGISGGLGAMVLFITLLTRSFSRIGSAMMRLRQDRGAARPEEFMLWGLGSVLAVHTFNWFGMVYFDQFYAFFFLQLAAAVSLAQAAEAKPSRNVQAMPGGRGLQAQARRRASVRTARDVRRAPAA